jgi:hypothetical protein
MIKYFMPLQKCACAKVAQYMIVYDSDIKFIYTYIIALYTDHV